MDLVRHNLSGKEYTIPETITFDVTGCCALIDLLLTTRNSDSPENIVEKGAAKELLLKEIGGNREEVFLHDADIYGVTSLDISDKIQKEIINPFLELCPYLDFYHLDLIALEASRAVYSLTTVDVYEKEYTLISI